MKITKKLAKEIFMGDFSNVNFEELTKDNKGCVNRFNCISEIEQLYKENFDIPILKKTLMVFVLWKLLKFQMKIINIPKDTYKQMFCVYIKL